MGFGLGSITNAVKSAAHAVSDAVGGAAHKVEDGAKAVESKAKSFWDTITDGFDDPKGKPLAESKPKGGSGASSSYA